MKRILAFTMALACVLMLCACGMVKKADNSSADQPAEQDMAEEKTVTVSTPYVDLRVPESFDAAVSHEERGNDPYVLTFKSNASALELFSFQFGGNGDNLLGTLIGENGNKVIYLDIPELDAESEHYEDDLVYQSQMNVIIEHMAEDYDIVFNEIVEPEDTAVFDIETSVVTLKYPEKWKDQVQVDVQEDGVRFSSNGTPLFDLMFKESDGFLLGTYKQTPIYMVEYPVETQEQAALQGSVNAILEYLMQDPDFVINQ